MFQGSVRFESIGRIRCGELLESLGSRDQVYTFIDPDNTRALEL